MSWYSIEQLVDSDFILMLNFTDFLFFFFFTLAASETSSQFPPVTQTFPLPIWARISSAVSSELLANGLKLANGDKTTQSWVDDDEWGLSKIVESPGKVRHLIKKLLVPSIPEFSRMWIWCLSSSQNILEIKTNPAIMVYSRIPRLQMSQAAS